MDRLNIDDGTEALHLASLFCQYGYFFPVTETKSLAVKDDSTLYRFQVGNKCMLLASGSCYMPQQASAYIKG